MATLAAKISGGLAKPDAADVAIPSVHDDPTYRAARALLTAFEQRLQQIERDRQCLDYELHFSHRAAESDGATDKELRQRWVALRAESQPARRSPVNPAAPPPAIAAGLAVLNGETVQRAPDSSTRYRELDDHRGILRAAIEEQTAECDRIAGDLSFRYSTELRPAWDRLQIEMYRAAQELVRSAARVRAFRTEMIAAGITPASQVIRMPPIRAPLFLGSESDWDSEISGWRRQLEAWNLL